MLKIMPILLCCGLSLPVMASAVTYRCAYIDKTHETLETLDNCAQIENESVRFLPELYAKTLRSPDGSFWAGMYRQEWPWQDVDYYINAEWGSMSVIPFDNGPDEYSEGLVRSRKQGKIGFYDTQFHPAIAPQFDFAWSFKQGKALVCMGCKPEPEGEHTVMVGGDWFYINKMGKRVSEIQHRPF